MSQFKYEKLIVETAKALQCFIEEYKRDRPKFLNNNNSNNNNNQQQPQIGELTEDKVKLITTYALLNLTNINNQKDFNLAIERYLNDLKTSEDGKIYVRYNNTWKEIDFNSFQGRPGRDGYTPYIQNGKWFLNNVDLGVNATGESAYDIAKRLNKPNTDSEESWVNSLKGDKGEPGEKGLKGDKGTSISSVTLSNESDKTYLNINLEDNTSSKLLLPLLKGDKGEPGRDVDPAVINRINQEIDKKVRYERVSDLNTLLTEKGILKVADGDNVEGAPVKGSNVWWHFIAGSHLNSLDWQYYLAFPLAIESADFWFKQKLATQDKSWVKFSGFSQLNGNGLFREWNLEHGLSTYIGNSNVYNVRTGVSGGASDLLFSLDNEKAYFSKPIKINSSIFLNEGILFKDKTQIHVRDNGNIAFGNKPFNDLVIGEFKGIQLWGQGNDKVVLAGGGVKNLSDFDFFKGYIEPDELNVFKPRETGAYVVKYAGGWGTLINFKSIGSTSSLEFFKSNWYSSSRIGVRNSVDSNRFNDDNGAFRYLAWFSDVYREGAKCEGSTTLRVDHQNQVIFVTTTCNIELSDIQNMGSVSFRKVFDGGSVTLSCSGKNIIYTADNQFNGKKGSTAVISIYENDCYIDIRNI